MLSQESIIKTANTEGDRERQAGLGWRQHRAPAAEAAVLRWWPLNCAISHMLHWTLSGRSWPWPPQGHSPSLLLFIFTQRIYHCHKFYLVNTLIINSFYVTLKINHCSRENIKQIILSKDSLTSSNSFYLLKNH